MPKYDVTFTVSPMQVEICIDHEGEGEDVDQQHSVAIEKAEGVLNNWLRFGITQWLGFPSHSIKVTYMDYEVWEVKEAVDGDNQ